MYQEFQELDKLYSSTQSINEFKASAMHLWHYQIFGPIWYTRNIFENLYSYNKERRSC